MRYYGTLGPACADRQVLSKMFDMGMTGLRLNTSHSLLSDSTYWLKEAQSASGDRDWELLIDLKGPEMRIGRLTENICLEEGGHVFLTKAYPEKGQIPLPGQVFSLLRAGQVVLLDDSRFRLRIEYAGTDLAWAKVLIGGELSSAKSLAIEGDTNQLPALAEEDLINLAYAGDPYGLAEYGIRLSWVMQPFVRGKRDLIEVRKALDRAGLSYVKIMAKIENLQGMACLEELMPYCDMIVIARGDLGMNVPLYELPCLQRKIERVCKAHSMPFMVVTQMLNSMIEHPVPTRAEVSDIANAAWDGAAAVMLTGETAAGKWPVEAMSYLVQTAENALKML